MFDTHINSITEPGFKLKLYEDKGVFKGTLESVLTILEETEVYFGNDVIDFDESKMSLDRFYLFLPDYKLFVREGAMLEHDEETGEWYADFSLTAISGDADDEEPSWENDDIYVSLHNYMTVAGMHFTNLDEVKTELHILDPDCATELKHELRTIRKSMFTVITPFERKETNRKMARQ